MSEAGVGAQVRRRRQAHGLSQERLAELAGINLKTLAKVENDTTGGVRLDTLHRIARALGVQTAELLSPPPGIHLDDQDATDMTLLGIRRVLLPAGDETEGSGPPDLQQLTRDVTQLQRRYYRGEYAALLQAVPGVIQGARACVRQQQGQAQDQARLVLAAAYREAGQGLIQLGQSDFGCHALDLAAGAARDGGDEILAADCAHSISLAYLRQRRLTDAEEHCTTAADAIEPRSIRRASGLQLAVWGNLLLRASASAARNNQPGRAGELLRAASAAAEMYRPEPSPLISTSFGPTYVRMMAVEHAVVAFDGAEALRRSRTVQDLGSVLPTCHSRHLLDVANAQLMQGQPRKAVDILITLKRRRPQWLKQQRYAADLTRSMLDSRARRAGRELAELAQFLSVA